MTRDRQRVGWRGGGGCWHPLWQSLFLKVKVLVMQPRERTLTNNLLIHDAFVEDAGMIRLKKSHMIRAASLRVGAQRTDAAVKMKRRRCQEFRL